jgi:hypothetical protein
LSAGSPNAAHTGRDLNELAVARTPRVGDDDAVHRLLLPAGATQAIRRIAFLGFRGLRPGSSPPEVGRTRLSALQRMPNISAASCRRRRLRLAHHLLHLAELLEQPVRFADRTPAPATRARREPFMKSGFFRSSASSTARSPRDA